MARMRITAIKITTITGTEMTTVKGRLSVSETPVINE